MESICSICMLSVPYNHVVVYSVQYVKVKGTVPRRQPSIVHRPLSTCSPYTLLPSSQPFPLWSARWGLLILHYTSITSYLSCILQRGSQTRKQVACSTDRQTVRQTCDQPSSRQVDIFFLYHNCKRLDSAPLSYITFPLMKLQIPPTTPLVTPAHNSPGATGCGDRMPVRGSGIYSRIWCHRCSSSVTLPSLVSASMGSLWRLRCVTFPVFLAPSNSSALFE